MVAMALIPMRSCSQKVVTMTTTLGCWCMSSSKQAAAAAALNHMYTTSMTQPLSSGVVVTSALTGKRRELYTTLSPSFFGYAHSGGGTQYNTLHTLTSRGGLVYPASSSPLSAYSLPSSPSSSAMITPGLGGLGLGFARTGGGLFSMQQIRTNWLEPKRLPYRKAPKAIPKGQQGNMELLGFGKYGIQTLEAGRLKAIHLEGARRVLVRHMKRKGQIWPRVACSHPVTRKPAEVRMGKGKGSVDHYVARCKMGQVIFEIDGVPLAEVQDAFKEIKSRMPLDIRLIQRDAWPQA